MIYITELLDITHYCSSLGRLGIFFFYMEPIKLTECQDALGKESRKISDDQITASLYLNLDHAPYRARLYNQENAGSWTTPDGSHWLQIDLRDRSIRATRVATQGRYYYDQWVTMYQLQYGDDGVAFQYYREQQGVRKVNMRFDIILLNIKPVSRLFTQQRNSLFNNAPRWPQKPALESKAGC